MIRFPTTKQLGTLINLMESFPIERIPDFWMHQELVAFADCLAL
jgi:hypothetical protein